MNDTQKKILDLIRTNELNNISLAKQLAIGQNEKEFYKQLITHVIRENEDAIEFYKTLADNESDITRIAMVKLMINVYKKQIKQIKSA